MDTRIGLATLVILYFAIVVIALRVEERKSPSNLLLLIFSIFHFIYHVSINFEFVAMPENFTRYSGIRNSEVFQMMIWAIVSYLGFYVGYRLCFKGKLIFRKIKEIPKGHVNLGIKRMEFILIVVVIMFVGVFSAQIQAAGTYNGNIELSENVLYKYAVTFITVWISILAAIYLLKLRLVKYIFAGVIMLIWTVYSSDKNPFVVFSVFSLLSFGVVRGRWLKSYIIFLLAVVIVPVISVVFSLYRADNLDTFEYRKALYQNTDSKGPYQSLVHATRYDKDFMLGTSYLNSYVTWIPKFFWRDRPDDLTTDFARSSIRGYSKGMGLGYNPIAEAYINFGVLGVFLHFFSIACFVALVLRLKSVVNSPLLVMGTFLFVGYYLVLMHRSSFNLPAEIVRIYLPIVFLISILKSSKGRRELYRASELYF